jgi:type I restriction enzyme S subunit
MAEWKEISIKEAPFEIIDGDRGVNYPSQDEFHGEGYCLFLSTKNVRQTGFDFSDCQFITKEKDALLRKGKLRRHDIVLTTRGTIGNLALYSNDIPFENIRINSGMVIIRPDEEKIGTIFCYYLFRHLQSSFETFTSGSAQPQLPVRDLCGMTILLPELPEQVAIASILSSLDDKIDLLHRQNKTLEQLAETLFWQWFVEEAKESSKENISLGEIIYSVSDTHDFPTDKIIFLNTSDIFRGQVITHEYSSLISLPGQAKKSISKNDILFSEIRPANGRWAYIDFDSDEYVVSTKLMVLRNRGIIAQEFIYFYLTHPQTTEWLQMIAESRSGTFPQITFDQIKDLRINIPSRMLLKESEIWCKTTLQKILKNNKQIRTLTCLRDTLMPKLMSGEVCLAADK